MTAQKSIPVINGIMAVSLFFIPGKHPVSVTELKTYNFLLDLGGIKDNEFEIFVTKPAAEPAVDILAYPEKFLQHPPSPPKKTPFQHKPKRRLLATVRQ
jgi:hypothetical protein